MSASSQEKFDAAVKVIRGLPKNGSFQPSHEMMLKFYAYYKQATEGPCTAPKPGIWNLVNRKKWEAWSELGDMAKERAMLLYVEELKNVSKHVKETLYPPEIVETMPQTEQVADFVQTLGNFYELVDEDGVPAVGKASHQSNGSAAFSRDPDRNLNHSDAINDILLISDKDTHTQMVGGTHENGNGTDFNGLSENKANEDGSEVEEEEKYFMKMETDFMDSQRLDSGSETDEFCDTSDQLLQVPVKLQGSAIRFNQQSSTPVDCKREARVHFAAHLHEVPFANGNPDYSNSNSSSSQMQLPSLDSQTQLLSSRLGLGSATGESFLPQNGNFPPRHLTDSLYVNDSVCSVGSFGREGHLTRDFSSASMDSMCNNYDDESNVGDGCLSVDAGRSITSRGGGDKEGVVTQGSQVSSSAGLSGTCFTGAGGRETSREDGGGKQRDLFPSGSGGGQRRGGGGPSGGSTGLNEQVMVTLLRLQQDMVDVLTRLERLEADHRLRLEVNEKKTIARSSTFPRWWPFPTMSKKMVFFLFIWPFIAHILINMMCRRR